MGLIKCPDCETEVSDSAVNCLKCGRPMKTTLTNFSVWRLLARIALYSIALVVIGFLLLLGLYVLEFYRF